jgi:NADH:ubiquinone oxidoreductase subunit 5 (subunit L)/multisubunit Na+/H+ antiporter MnhA subunit
MPPLSLWVSKDEVLAAALARSPALYGVGLLGAVIAAAYSAKAVWFVWRPEPSDAAAGWDTEERGTRRVSAFAPPALVALAGSAAVLGVLAFLPIGELVGTQPSPAARELALSAVLAGGAAAASWRWGDRPIPGTRPLHGWLGLERAVGALLVTPTMALARALATFDDRVLHRAVLAVPAAGLRLARLADRRAEFSISGAVAAVVAGARRLGELARRPQTGQLHQYYAQAAVALAVLALLVVVVR